jgi:hemerythrin
MNKLFHFDLSLVHYYLHDGVLDPLHAKIFKMLLESKCDYKVFKKKIKEIMPLLVEHADYEHEIAVMHVYPYWSDHNKQHIILESALQKIILHSERYDNVPLWLLNEYYEILKYHIDYYDVQMFNRIKPAG